MSFIQRFKLLMTGYRLRRDLSSDPHGASLQCGGHLQHQQWKLAAISGVVRAESD